MDELGGGAARRHLVGVARPRVAPLTALTDDVAFRIALDVRDALALEAGGGEAEARTTTAATGVAGAPPPLTASTIKGKMETRRLVQV